MRRRMLVSLATVLAAGSLVIGSSVAVAGASAPEKGGAPLCAGKTKKAAIKAIKVAYDYFLNGAANYTAEQKESYIQNMDKDPDLAALFVKGSEQNAGAAATTNVQVDKVTCKGKKKADVDAQLVLNGTPTPGIFPSPGGAILVGKVWKVTQQTFCDLTALGDSTVLESGPCAG